MFHKELSPFYVHLYINRTGVLENIEKLEQLEICIEDRERELKQLQNQILKDIENNPNYDDITKQNLQEQVLNHEI